MGMDYYPRSRKTQGFHLNWTGHEFMGRVLDLTEAERAANRAADRASAEAWRVAMHATDRASKKAIDDGVEKSVVDEVWFDALATARGLDKDAACSAALSVFIDASKNA